MGGLNLFLIMDVKICLLLLLAAALAFAMEAPLGRRVRYFRAGPPKEFTRVGRTHPNNPVNRTLGSGQYIVTYDDGEANLDMEMITTFGVGATTDFFVVDESKGWMYEYTQELISTQILPMSTPCPMPGMKTNSARTPPFHLLATVLSSTSLTAKSTSIVQMENL